jgi:hypothetical protein
MCTQLGEDELKNLTYGLSFQYGTATKATRSISVLQYADKLANSSLGYAETIGHIPDGEESTTGQDIRVLSFRTLTESSAPTSFHVHQSA